jgi:hypothetical protein
VAGIDPEKVKKVKFACENNLKFLCKEFLGMTDWDDNVHDGLSKFLSRPTDYKLILMPRGHFKSSVVTIGYTIQSLLKNPNKRFLITNARWDMAADFLDQIKDYFLNSDLKHFYGEFYNKDLSWTKTQITLAQKSDKKKRGPSIKTAGVESVLTGSHYDNIINDDLVEMQNVRTKEQIQKVIDFHDSCFDLLDPGGQLIDIGTRWSEDDLYGDILKTRCDTVNGHPLKKGSKWRDYVTF